MKMVVSYLVVSSGIKIKKLIRTSQLIKVPVNFCCMYKSLHIKTESSKSQLDNLYNHLVVIIIKTYPKILAQVLLSSALILM
jgi:hypothetical protein